jgi:hypothetical protein
MLEQLRWGAAWLSSERVRLQRRAAPPVAAMAGDALVRARHGENGSGETNEDALGHPNHAGRSRQQRQRTWGAWRRRTTRGSNGESCSVHGRHGGI